MARPHGAGPDALHRARGLCGVLGLWGLAALGCAGEMPVERVVLLTVDTLRADHVGAYGSEEVRTPTLDGIAARGALFEHAISPAPLTLPTHATLFTGLDPPEHGVRHNGVFRLTDEIPTVTEALAARGFRTGAFVGAFVLDRRFGLARGFEHYDDDTERPSSRGGLRGYAERPADAVVDAALAWLAQVERHFFLWVHVYDPHAEYAPPPGFAAAYPSNPYAGEIAFADAELGRLLAFVRTRWDPRRTLVVATSDHGESLGEHGEATHSHTIYDATQRVPLLVEGPGIAAGRTVESVVALRDVALTILELVGAPPLPGASGTSLAPVLRRGREPAPQAAYMETLATQLDWGWSPLLGLRTAHHKFIAAPRPELFDVVADPRQLQDLADREPERVAELEAILEERLAAAEPALVEARFAPDTADRARLEALGYVVPSVPASEALALGQVGGVDPKDRMHVIRAVHEADRLLGQGRPEASLARLDGVEGLEEEGLVVQAMVSAAALAAGQVDRAEAAARAAVAAAPDSTVGLRRLVAALEHQGRLEEAAAAYAEMLRLEAGSGAPHTGLGRLAERMGDAREAERRYRLALEAPRSDGEARWRLAALHLEDGRPAEADLLLAEPPAGGDERDEEAALRLARAERAAGRLEAAVQRLREAMARHPGELRLRLALAEALAERGDAGEAREVAGQGLAMAERGLSSAEPAARPYLYVQRARALAALGRSEEAKASLAAAHLSRASLPWDVAREAAALAARLGLSDGDGLEEPGRERSEGADK